MSTTTKPATPSAAVPTKALVLRTRNDAAVLARLQAQAEAAARPPDDVHPAVRHLVPAEYSPEALGWTVPIALQEERDEQDEPTGRVAVVAEESFARGKADFAGAADGLPGDWRRGKGGAANPPGGGTRL